MTPTGAAVVAAFRTSDRLPEDFTMLKPALEPVKRQKYRCPGILRAMLIRETTDRQIKKDIIWKLETDMDDCGGEMMGHVMNLLAGKWSKRGIIHRFIRRRTDRPIR